MSGSSIISKYFIYFRNFELETMIHGSYPLLHP